jgi:hypothetical protein
MGSLNSLKLGNIFHLFAWVAVGMVESCCLSMSVALHREAPVCVVQRT